MNEYINHMQGFAVQIAHNDASQTQTNTLMRIKVQN